MPYALFFNDAKLSKAYPTEADVGKHARKSGLVVDVVSHDEIPTPRPVLDNDYEVRPCQPDPLEDPAKNQADAEREEEKDFQLSAGAPPAPQPPNPSNLFQTRVLRPCRSERGLIGNEAHAGFFAMQT